MIRNLVFVVAAVSVALAPAAARADRRYYGETYTASIAPKGSLDLELWSTFHDSPRDGSAPALWRHQLELETGLTDSWDVAVYNIWRQNVGESIQYEALKGETRYRLAPPGAWWVDTVLYLEVRKEFIEDRPLAIEEKVILSKDMGRLNVAANLALEQEFIPGGNIEHDFEWAGGTSWEIVPALRAGGEAFGSVIRTDEEGVVRVTSQAWAGPAVSIAWSKYWLVLAAGFGLNDASERVRLRAVFSWNVF
jgi:hypothetical protein